MKKIFHISLALSLLAVAAIADVVTARVTFTNATNLKNAAWTNGATITVNSDTRTWTNSVSSAATQIPLTSVNGTNIVQQVQLLLGHARGYAFTGVTPSSDLLTYVELRGTNGQSMSVSISPSTYAAITYSTNTVGTGYVVRLPITVETPANRTNIANMLVDALALSPNATFMSVNRTEFYTSVSESARYTLGPFLKNGDVVFQPAAGPTSDYNQNWLLVDSNYATNAAGWVSIGTKPFAIYSGGTVTPSEAGSISTIDHATYSGNSIVVYPTNNAAFTTFIDSGDGLDGVFNLKPFGGTLDTINVQFNNLTEFNMTGLTALVELMLQNNSIGGSFSANSSSALEYLDLSFNAYTSFDGNGLTALTYLDLSGNPITNLVAGNMGAGGFSLTLTGCTNLITLDVSGVTNLTSLDATGNALSSASVNNTLTNLAWFGLSNGVVDLSGGTSATTNAAGSAAVQTLVSRGWSVGHN